MLLLCDVNSLVPRSLYASSVMQLTVLYRRVVNRNMPSNAVFRLARMRCRIVVVIVLLSVIHRSTEKGNTSKFRCAERPRDAPYHYVGKLN